MELLNINDITVRYGNSSVPAIEHFNLQMKEGEIIAIVGESGSGKTTVIRSVLGLLPENGRVEQGDIFFQGNSLLKFSKEQWRALRGTEISVIFQDSGAMINPIRRIGSQFVEYIRTHQQMSRKEAWTKGAGMLRKMNLPDSEHIMKSYPFQLSGGMRQRIGIAMAMAFQPKLLLADEPTSALDVTTQAQIVRQFMELREQYGTAVMIVTHNIGVAAYMADRLIVMKHGEIVDAGPRDSVINRPVSEYTRKLLASVPDLEGKRYV